MAVDGMHIVSCSYHDDLLLSPHDHDAMILPCILVGEAGEEEGA